MYGKGLILYQIKSIDPYYEDVEIKIDNSRISIDGKIGVDRIHTLSLIHI